MYSIIISSVYVEFQILKSNKMLNFFATPKKLVLFPLTIAATCE